MVARADVVLDYGDLAAPQLTDGNCKPAGSLVPSPLVLSLVLSYGYLVLNVFIQCSSRSSPFSSAIGHTVSLT